MSDMTSVSTATAAVVGGCGGGGGYGGGGDGGGSRVVIAIAGCSLAGLLRCVWHGLGLDDGWWWGRLLDGAPMSRPVVFAWGIVVRVF